MNSFLNISAYRFVALQDPQALRASLAAPCAELGLVGTILLACEGINLFLAGPPHAIRAFVQQLRTNARFAGMEGKKAGPPRRPFAGCASRASAKSSA